MTALLRRDKFPAPEFARAAAIFRLQRFGVAGPRLLAMGHRRVTAWQRFSFLLTEPPVGPSLATVLRQDEPPARRQRLLRKLGVQLRQVHEAGFVLRADANVCEAWVVVADGRLALTDVAALERTAAPRLALFAKPQAMAPLSRTDRLRVLLGYLGLRRTDARARALLGGKPPERQVA
jgi:hypothetical protein